MTTGSPAAAALDERASAPNATAVTPATRLDAAMARRANVSAASTPTAHSSSDRVDTYVAAAPISGCNPNVAAAKNAAQSPLAAPGVKPGSDRGLTLV